MNLIEGYSHEFTPEEADGINDARVADALPDMPMRRVECFACRGSGRIHGMLCAFCAGNGTILVSP